MIDFNAHLNSSERHKVKRRRLINQETKYKNMKSEQMG